MNETTRTVRAEGGAELGVGVDDRFHLRLRLLPLHLLRLLGAVVDEVHLFVSLLLAFNDDVIVHEI